MGLSALTLTSISPNSTIDQNTISYFFKVSAGAGTYTTGGLTLNLAGYVYAPGVPIAARVYSWANPLSTYTYQFVPGTTQANGLLQIFKNGTEIAQESAATITNIALTSNVVTITATNTFAVGDTVAIAGVGTATFLNGQTLTVATASGSSFTAAFTHANYATAADTGTATPASSAAVPTTDTITGIFRFVR